MADDLRGSIITTKTSERLLNRVSPIYDDSYVGLWLYEIMGREFQNVWDIMDTIPQQFFPETATWALPFWERRYGLETDESLPIQTRRERIIEMRDKERWFGNYRLETWLAERSGGAVTVIDHIDTFMFGIRIESETRLSPNFDQHEAVRYINQRKPSHLSYKLQYHAIKKIDLYAGIALYGSCIHALGPVPMPNLEAERYLVDELGNYLMDENFVVITD